MMNYLFAYYITFNIAPAMGTLFSEGYVIRESARVVPQLSLQHWQYLWSAGFWSGALILLLFPKRHETAVIGTLPIFLYAATAFWIILQNMRGFNTAVFYLAACVSLILLWEVIAGKKLDG